MSDTQPGKRQKQTTVLGTLVTRLLANSFPDAPNQLLMVDMCANNLAGLLEKAARDATNDDGQYRNIDDPMTQFSVTRPTTILSPVKLEFIFYFDTDETLSARHRETYCESGDQRLDLFPDDFSMTAIELECFDTTRSSSYSVIFDVSNDSVATLSCSAGLQFIGDWSKLIAELCGDALVYGQWALQFDISATTAAATALAIDNERHYWTGLQGKLHQRILIGMLSTEQPARFVKARVASDTVNRVAFAAGDYLQILGDYSEELYTGVHMESKTYGYIPVDSVVPVRPGTQVYDTLLRQLMPTWQYPTLALYPNRQAKYTDPHTGLLQTITWRGNSVFWQVGTGPGAVTVVYDSTTLHMINIQPHADTAYLGGLPSFKQICALYAPTASSTAADVQRWLASVGVPATPEVDGSYLCGLTAPELGTLLDIDAERAKQIKALLSPVSTYFYGCISVTVLADQIAHVNLVAGTTGARSVVSECHIPILCPFYMWASNVDICWNNQRSDDWQTGTITVGPNTGILLQAYDDSAKPCTHFTRSAHMLQFAYEWNLHIVDAYDVTPHALFAPHMSIGNVRCNPGTGDRAWFVLAVNSATKKDHAFIRLYKKSLSLCVSSFFFDAKIKFPAEYARIMALIKTRRRTPMGLLNDVIATFSASPAFSTPPPIELTDLWEGYSSGGVVAPKVTCTLTFDNGVEDVVKTNVVTGNYTLHHRRRGDNTTVPEGAFAIKSDDLINTASRALATYRLGIGPNKTNAQLMKTGFDKWWLVIYPESAPLIGAGHASFITGTSYPIQTITTFGNDGTKTTIRPAIYDEQDMCNFVAEDNLKQVTIVYHKTQELMAAYIIKYTKDDLNKGAVGSSGLGWTPQEYQIYETIKNYDLLSIAQWGYYGKLYGLDRQPLRGYGELRSSFCDLCIGPRQPVPMLNSPTGQTRF